MSAQAYDHREPVARKPHICCDCEGCISIGEKYIKIWGVWDGDVGTYKYCTNCWEILQSINDKIPDYDNRIYLGGLHEFIMEVELHKPNDPHVLAFRENEVRRQPKGEPSHE